MESKVGCSDGTSGKGSRGDGSMTSVDSGYDTSTTETAIRANETDSEPRTITQAASAEVSGTVTIDRDPKTDDYVAQLEYRLGEVESELRRMKGNT